MTVKIDFFVRYVENVKVKRKSSVGRSIFFLTYVRRISYWIGRTMAF